MVSRNLLAGALAMLSSRAVIAGPCRLVSSVEASYSTTIVVSASTEFHSTHALETSLTVPMTDVTTSTIIEEATTTTADDLTTTTMSFAVPTTFKLRAHGNFADDLALKSEGNPGGWLAFGELTNTFQEVIFSFDEKTGYIQYDSKDVCVYYDDDGLAAQVKTCTSLQSGRQGPLTCEKPTSNQLKCMIPGKTCSNPPSFPIALCTPTGDEWAQLFVRPYVSGSFLFYLGNGNAMADELDDMDLRAVDIELSRET
ncbi:hypothetical protein FPOA_05053 [Fusarium poae]|uniref:Uncharacterized protein n=1 Tax=Fusarium poae TaxID=36050 RepID=A0A1B8AVH1_FUSPO|nr:hypothetical protein FPOA_05053 [Fusarium poae]